MKRLSKQFISVLLVLCMVMSFFGVLGSAATTATATLVTDASSLKVGDQIVIVASGYDYAMSTTQNNNNRGRAAITKDGNTITVGDDTQIITLEAGLVDGTFAFKVDGDNYLYAASSSSNYLRSGATLTENSSWKITIDAATGVAGVVASGSYTRNTLRYNTSGLFACYAASNTQKDVSIYLVTNSGESGGTEEPTPEEPAPVGTTATLVTDGSKLNAGDQIIIVALDADAALSTTQNSNNRAQATIAKSADGATVTFYDDTQVITLADGTVSGTLALCVGEGQYLYAASSSSNHLKTGTLNDNASFRISVDAATGVASVVAAGTNTRNTLRYNTSSSLFACYAESNTMKDICIYMVTDTAGSGSGSQPDSGEQGGSGSEGGSDNEGGSSEGGSDQLNYTATLVTNASSLKVGDRIFIVAYEADFVLSTTQNTSNRGQTSVIKNGNNLIASPDAQVITLVAGNVSGTFGFEVEEGKYLYAAGSSANNLKTSATLSDNASWAISIDAETGIAGVVGSGEATRNTLRHNPSSGLFSCYLPNNTQSDIAIYMVTGTTTDGSFGGESGDDNGDTNIYDDAGNSDSTCNHNWKNGTCSACGVTYILMVTTPTGYTSASQVVYVTENGYIVNWGARGEEISFLSTYAENFYTGSYTFDILSGMSSSQLYTALQTLMESNHVTFTKYSSSNALDCKNLFLYTDCLLSNTSYVSTLYRGLYVSSTWNSAVYNQEHVWPNSKCAGTNNTDIGDIMHLRPANPSENSSRGNLAYGESDGYYDPGLSVRGDVARTVLYMYTRWGNTNLFGIDGVIESEEILLKWIAEDPVDTWEMGRNDSVQSITGTRNVFVDYPEYAYLLLGEEIPADLKTPSSEDAPTCNHSYDNGVITSAAGCTTTGIKTYTCSLCGDTKTEVIAAVGHSYSSVVTAPTCTEAGYTTSTCSKCGDTIVDNAVGAKGHSFENGTCTVCGAADPNFVVDYYLIGYINGANYGCEEDFGNMGSYKFENGKLVAIFNQDSYVFIKTGNNAKWYMFKEYVPTNSGTLYETGKNNVTEKMFVPGGVEVTFTLVANSDGTLSLSYVTKTAEIVVPTLSLNYPSLSFEDEILYNVYYGVDNTTSIVEMGLITFNEKLVDGTIADAVDVIPGYLSDGTTYMAQSKGIPAKKLGDALYFKVYAKLIDGSYVYSDVAGYHAVAYAKTVLNNTSSTAKAKALVVAMLNYGAAAQVQFEYKTDSLMNASLIPAQQALVQAYDPSMVADVVRADNNKVGSFVMNGGYANLYPTVSFEGAFSINYYFVPNKSVDDVLTFYYWDSATYNSVATLTPDNATGVITMTQDGGNWGAAVAGIAAKQIDETIYVAGIYTSNGVSYPTSVISYSLGKYCQTIAAQDNAFGAATAVYGYYAKAFFAN